MDPSNGAPVQTPESWQPWLELIARVPAAVWIFVAATVGYSVWRGGGWWQRGAGERALKRRQRIAEQAEIDAARANPQPTLRAVAPGMEKHLYTAQPVLDHGFVRAID